MISERKLSVSVSVSAEISAEMSVSVSAFLKLSVSADISVHSPAEILVLYPAKIPTFCLKFTIYRFFSQNILRFLNFLSKDRKFSTFC